MPLERPRREPIIGADGKMAPVWVRYFEELDSTQTVSDDFEAKVRFLLNAPAVDPGVRQTKARVSTLEARVKKILFLGV